MNNIELRESLLTQADTAFFQLAGQINELFDAAQFYIDRYAVITASDKIKATGLNSAIEAMGRLPDALAGEIERWKKGEDRVLSRLGVELEILNELYATVEATMLFLIREDICLERFSLGSVKQAYHELLRCNRLL